MQQSNLLDLAKQGEPSAIAALMNAVLSPKGITAQTSLEDDCLCIVLESQKPLNQETLVTFIQKGLLELGNDSIRSVRAQEKRVGHELCAWTREFSLQSAVSTSQAATSQVTTSQVTTSQTTTLAPPLDEDLIGNSIDSEEIEAEELEDIELDNIGLDNIELEAEESLSFQSWVKQRWRVYAVPVGLVVIGGFVAGGTTAFWSTSKQQAPNLVEAVMKPRQDSSIAIQKEAETYLKAMTAAQENFYKQNKRFASSLEELERSTNVISQSYSYAYRLQVGTESMITAIPREADLRSYIGIVSQTPSGTTTVICQSLKPSVQAPEKPKVAKGMKTLSCGARSQKLPEPPQNNSRRD